MKMKKTLYEEKKNEIRKWKEISKTFSIETELILQNAENFQKAGLKAFDSLHLACAISSKCDCFITVDKGILKLSDKLDQLIEILSPIQFISKLENAYEN